MGELSLSVALPPSAQIPEYARAAEGAGCARLWLFDSPAVYGDLWIAVARAADATSDLGVGTGVAVPALRHPMVTAAAIATIEQLAPGRLTCAFGTGFTARRAMGQKPMRWAAVSAYLRQVASLLDGDVVDIDGAACQMLQLPGWAPDRPLRTPLWVAPSGPKGMAVAEDVDAAGLLLSQPPPQQLDGRRPAAMIVSGTVLGSDEDHTSDRVVEAAGPWYAAMWHAVYEAAPDFVTEMPGGGTWLEGLHAVRGEGQLHLGVHEGHVCALTDRDRAAIREAGAAILEYGWTGSPEHIRAAVADSAALGITEIVYTPAGPDIAGEIESFAKAFHG
ncbi:LLM class flavin-dependent oxidoreductase [Nocardia sp. NBC_00565]|uniref:LLM class flavin-dependent oxidoreductase n=1 Tax=Nocardia sp. NBC_00565 TaxID=2975993 RepID=UPI002E812955|nr:LLM class flavin-dependent oxidoreductase [Nocardia sp. NBC_00565]WUC01929.1 LLM class flavin-dependent oxidoreductase [Nocardia sp. NBC_00565]